MRMQFAGSMPWPRDDTYEAGRMRHLRATTAVSRVLAIGFRQYSGANLNNENFNPIKQVLDLELDIRSVN